MIEEAEKLMSLVKECLHNVPAARPKIADVCERIQLMSDAYVNELQKIILLYIRLQIN